MISNFKKHGFKTIISWNRYSSEITKQSKTKNLYYMIDIQELYLTFRNINRLSFYSKMVSLILQDFHLIGITCHKLNSKILMHSLIISTA